MTKFIPQNLDVDSLILKFPPVEVQRFCVYKLIHILDLINSIPASNRQIVCDDGFVPLNAAIMQKSIRNYREYLDYLIRIKVIETNGHYVPGGKSTGFRFTVLYETFLKPIVLPNTHLAYKRNQRRKKPKSAARQKAPYLFKWYNTGIKINAETAKAFIDEDYRRKKDNPKLRDYDYRRNRYKKPIEQYKSAQINIRRIEDGEFLPYIDESVGRFHSVLTNIRSQLRNCLSYRGKTLVCYDIRCSQPYQILRLFEPSFWDQKARLKCVENGVNYQFLCSTSSIPPLLPPIIMLVKDAITQAGSGFELYRELVSSGRFYEYIEQEMRQELRVDRLTPRQLKEVVFTTLFTSNNFIGQKEAAPKRLFRRLFPNEYKIFSLIKKHDKTHLPRLLQRIESHIVLEKICGRINAERPEVPLFTIHDSISTTLENGIYVEEVMRQELTKAIGYSPTIKKSDWCPTNLKFNDDTSFHTGLRIAA